MVYRTFYTSSLYLLFHYVLIKLIFHMPSFFMLYSYLIGGWGFGVSMQVLDLSSWRVVVGL